MFAKLKKNMAKKGVITVWLIITTLYTIIGIYNYFKYQVYTAGANTAITQIVADVVTKNCSEPTQLFSGDVTLNLIDIACLQTSESTETSVTQ